jgi:hypothetical protein
MGIVTEFGTAINKLDEFSRQQVLEQVFGKFQYARMSALFTNITKDAGQAARAMDLAGMSAEDLAKISEKELGQISESTSVKFQASMEKLKISIAPIGEAFLKGITPVVDMVSKIADAFNNLPDGVKNAIAVLTGVVAGIGPVLLMTIGLLGNGIANITKFVQFIRKSLAGIKGDASAFTYLAQGELEAVTASKALEGSAVNLTDKLLLQRGAVVGLTAEYERFARAAGIARAEMGLVSGAPMPSGGGRQAIPVPRIRKNTGGTIPGVGSTDTVPAMLTPGEFVINKKATAQNLPLLHAINDGKGMGGFNKGGQIPGVQYFAMAGKVLPKPKNVTVPKGTQSPQMTHTTPKPILSTIGTAMPQRILGSARGRVAQRLANAGIPVELLTDAWIRSPFNQKLKSKVQGSTITDWVEDLKDSQLGPAYRRAEIRASDLREELRGSFLSENTYTQEDFGNIIEDAAKRIKPSFSPAIDSAYLPKPEVLREYSEQLESAGFYLQKNEANGKNYIVDSTEVEKRQMASSSYPLTRNKGGLIPGGEVTQSRPFYGVFNAKTIDMFKNWIGTHSEAIPALRQTILKDPKMKSMFGSAFLKSKEPETLLRSQFMSSVPEIGSELSLGALRSFSAEGTDVVRHLADSKIRKEAEKASYELGVDQKRQKRDAARLRKAETVGLPSWSPEHKYRSPVGGATGIDAWMEDTRRSIEQGKAGIKKSKSKIRDYRKLNPTIIRLKTPAGTIRANLDDIVPQIEQQYGTSGSSYQVQEQERILNNARIKVSGKSTDKNGITTLDAELIESFGLNKGGTIPGSGNTDTVPAMLTPGEFVVNKKATQSNIDLLHAINSNGDSQSMKKFNKGGMIGDVQYFAEGGEAQSDRGSASGSGAYKAETRRVMAVGWDSLQTELDILKEMKKNNELNETQVKAFSQGETSHITPEVGPNGGKMWRPSNMMADLGLINNYIEAQKGTSKKALGNAKLFDEIQSKTSLSAERLRAELDLLSRGFHATTKESAMALRALSQVGDQTGQKIAVSRVLDARLQGTFYDTLNAPERQYRSDLPVEEKFGKRSKRSKPDRNIPQPETRDPMRPPKLSAQEADKIKRNAEREARSSLGIAPHRGFSASQGGGGYDQNDIFIPQQVIDEESKKIRTREYDKRNKEHGREQARLIAASKQSEMNQPTPPTPPTPPEIDADKQGKRAKMGRGMAKAGGVIGMASMLPFMMQDQEGKFMGMDANMLGMGMMGAGMAMPAIGSAMSAGGGAGMLAGGGVLATLAPVLAPLAAAAAVAGVGLMLWRKNIDETSKETSKLASNVGVTANSLGEVSKILGVSTPSQRQAQMNLGITKEDIQNQEIISPILQSEGGQKFIEELKTATSEERFKKLADYTKAAIASGMMDKSMASTFAKGVSLSLNDVLLGRRMMPVISGQKIGSGGMMSIADERISALNKSSEIKRVAAASGESRTITTADAAYTVGATTQVISDLSNVIALAREEYDKGTISFEKMRSTVDKATASQNEYSSMLTKAISGSMEQGGTRQALNDALVTMGVDPEKISTFKNAMDIGVGGLGVSAFQQEQTKRILTEKGMSGNIVTNPNAIGSSRSAAYGARFSNLTGSTKSFENYQAAKDQAAKDESAIVNAQTSGLAEQLLQAVAANKITIDQANLISEQVKTGSKFGMDLVREFNAGAKDLGGTLNALFVASSRTADIAGVSDAKVMGISQKDRYISAGAAFGRKGGDVDQYAALIESIPSQKRIDIITTFNGLTYEQQSKQIADMTQLSAIGGAENTGKLQSSDFYQGQLKAGKTGGIVDRAKGAAAAGVGEDYLNVMATISAEDNGVPISSKEYNSRSKLVLKSLKDFSSNDKIKKQEAGIVLLQQIENPDGKKITAAEAEKGMQDLMKKFGKGKTLNLPPTIFRKVIILQSKILGLQQMIDAKRLALSTASGEGARDLRLSLRADENQQVGIDEQILSEYNQSGVTGGGDGEGSKDGGGGGSKANPLLDLKKSILDQIKMYVDINATMKKLNDQKYKFSDMISGKGGVLNRLRGLKGNAGGLSDSVIDAISGMGPDAAKKWIEKNTKGGKLTKEGQNQADLLNSGKIRGTIEGNLAEFRGARAQRKAYRNLRGRGLDNSVVQAIAGDPEKAKELEVLQARVNAGIKKSVKDMNAFINSQIKATKEAELLARAQDPLQTKIDDLTMAHRIDSVVINKQIKIYEDQITAINKEITAIQELNSKDQNRIRDLDRQKEIINRQIEILNRANELDQRRADALRREDDIRNRAADSLNHELDIMSKQEQKIQDAYNKRIKALDEVAKINDYIINQQKSQLGLADALSRGDISAAVSVQQDMQAGNAQFATEQMRSGLQTGVDNQIAGLTTTGGLTRDQAEAQISAIKEQSYQTSLLIRDIEDAIYQRNLQMIPLKDSQLVIDNQIRVIQDAMYVRETSIIEIQNGKLANAQKQLDKELEIKTALDDKFNSQVADYELQKDIVDMIDAQSTAVAQLSRHYEVIANQIDNINKLAAKATSEIKKPIEKTNETETDFNERYKRYEDRISAIEAKRAADAAAVVASMTPVNKAVGGLIGDGARDSIPAMLTPGEFVMRKASVQKYGSSMLEKMNMGAFEMPRYNVQGPQEQTKASNTNNTSINAPVYNTYSVNVNVPNTNADPDVIANKVMMRMTQIDNSNIRSLRGNK